MRKRSYLLANLRSFLAVHFFPNFRLIKILLLVIGAFCLSIDMTYSQGTSSDYSKIYYILSDSLPVSDSLPDEKDRKGQKPVIFMVNPEDARHTDQFYDSLRYKAGRHYLLQTIHDFLIVPTRESKLLENDKVNDIENPFLQYRGKEIDNVIIRQLNVFGTAVDDTVSLNVSWYKDFANWMHIFTKKEIIHENLLFEKGDSLDPLLLADNERVLRNLQYIKDARILVNTQKDSQKVDVIVITQDVWSKGYNVDLKSINSGEIRLFDNNIFGIGHRFQADLMFDYLTQENFGYQTSYKLNNLMGSFIDARFFYLDAFENFSYGMHFSREFYSYKTRWVGGVTAYKRETVQNIRKEDTMLLNVPLNYVEHDAWIGYGFPISSQKGDFKDRNRLVLSARYNRNKFFEGPEVSERYNYHYHNNHLFLANVSFSRQNFYKTALIYGFGQTEDIPVGDLLGYTFGWEADEFFRRFYSGINLKHGNYYPNFGYLSNSLNFGGFIYDGSFEQGVLNFRSSYISKLFEIDNLKLRQFVNLQYKYGINRFSDEYIRFDRRKDIRGFDESNLFGDKKLVLKLETVGFTNLFYYGFRFAVYGFMDFGFIGPESKLIFKNPLHSGFGLGFRVRNENLVFQTFQIRLGYYPDLSFGNSLLFKMSGEKTLEPERYTPTAPGTINF